MDNAAQAEFWNGEAGEHWAAEAEQFDRLLAPFVDAVLGRAGIVPGQSVLDVGCGSGALSLAALDAGAGQVTGIDISVPMLSLARQRAGGLAGAEFLEADASSWQANTAFDRLISRFGVMFFGDPVAAFANLHAQMAERGKLAFACWQPLRLNDWASAPLMAAMPLLKEKPVAPEPGTPGPFAFEDADRTLSILTRAGWKNAEATGWNGKVEIPGATIHDAASFMSKSGPAARLVAEQDIDQADVLARLEAMFAERADDDGIVRFGAAVWILTADA